MATVGPPGWDLRGDVRCRIEVAGVVIDVLADVVHDEVARRSSDGPAPGALDWRQLGALSLLPHGVPIPWAEVDRDTRALLDGLPPGAIIAHERHVERRWRPALELRAISSTSATPHPALDDISMFAAVAPRVLILTATPCDAAVLAYRAAHLGVAVLVETGGIAQTLAGPPAVNKVRDDARRWEFAEIAYEALQDAASDQRSASSVAAG
jgi:hypothetical protein